MSLVLDGELVGDENEKKGSMGQCGCVFFGEERCSTRERPFLGLLSNSLWHSSLSDTHKTDDPDEAMLSVVVFFCPGVKLFRYM
jgi:hypothetical protein